ncbi:MAG TPA: hypothetical protein VGP95_19540 [Gemmatimonadaceae bacterium]|jgi:hypothetical protein|nr:hypothetical protein [Gemmatimonadaceae bacterium]
MGFVVAAIIIVALAHYAWQRRAARDIVDRWLMENRFRAVDLRIPWFSVGNFPMKLFRSQKSAVVFRAVVEDRSFGGTGIVWFRVWPGLAGKLGEEIEVSWEKMPERAAEDAPPLEEGWWSRQLELLRRVQRGETTFRLRGHDPEQGKAFDELVEYLLALQRRGLVTFGTPLANMRGESQYAAVTDVTITHHGEELLARESAGKPDTDRDRAGSSDR